MNQDTTPRQEGETSPPPTAAPPYLTPDRDPQKEKDLRDAINSILKGIPFIGPYIVIVKLKWGWAGILLLVGGFLLGAAFAFVGLLPESVVSGRYKSALPTPPPPPAESRDYELKSQDDMMWDAMIRNAKSRIWASGVALAKINPQLVTERVREGVAAQVVYVNPCGETIKRRQADENNPNASSRITGSLKTFDAYTKDFSQTQKNSLQVKFTDVYPTMIVVIIDDDLYAYFCPYGAVCSNSPVLAFRGYHEKRPPSASAKFFEDHFIAVSNNAKPVTNYAEPCSP